MADFRRSPCPIAATLDTLGDRWSLVLIRDMVAGKRRFGEFLDSPEGIKTNILAERLRRLEAAGQQAADPRHPALRDRYRTHLDARW